MAQAGWLRVLSLVCELMAVEAAKVRIGRMRLPPLSNVYEMAGKIFALCFSFVLAVEKQDTEILEKLDSNRS